MEVVLAHKAEILAVLLIISEVLGSSEKFKSSSVFQLVVSVLKSLAPKKPGQQKVIESLFKITEYTLGLLKSKEARKYKDRVIHLRKLYYAEENKADDARNHALMDNIRSELCLLADSATDLDESKTVD